MKNQKPNIFANQINKKMDNCQQIYYSKHEVKNNNKIKPASKEVNKTKDIVDIEHKIDELIKLPDYLFEKELEIITDKDIITTKIAGRNSKNIITIDNKLIPLKNIIDIKEKK